MLIGKPSLPETSADTKLLLLYLITAYLFAFGIRSLLYFQTSDISAFWLDSEPLPIWSPDAGLYGYYAKQILSGHNYPFSAEYMPGYLVAFTVKVLGISVDKAMFWLPAMLSSLIVVPVILSAHALRQTTLGFIAALIAGSGANYYTRSHLGYMDTDTLNLFLPWMAITFWIFALVKKRLLWAVLGALLLLCFKLWYHSSASVLLGLVAGLLVTVVLFYRKEPVAYAAMLLAATVIVPLHGWMPLAAIAALGTLFYLVDSRSQLGIKPYLALLLIGVIAAPFVIDINTYIERAQDYLQKPEMLEIATPHGLYRFADVLATVIEAEGAPIWQINALFSGLIVFVVPAIAGFLLMAWAYPALWVAAPMLVLGVLSETAGIRFTMYATPALALGFAYLAFLATYKLTANPLVKRLLPYGFGLAAVALMLFNVLRFNPHLQPFYFKHNEVKALHAFVQKSKRNDTILSWWDFGWPLWYYTGRNNTLLDNGRHGSDTFYIGNMLLSSNPVFVANAARYANQIKNSGHPEVTPFIARHGDVFEKFRAFSRPDTNLSSSGDAYILLHRDMLAVLPTIAEIADRDPRTGKPTRQRQFYISDLRRPFTGKSPMVYGDTFTLDLRNGVITGNDGASTRVGGVVVSENGELTAAQRYDKRSPMFIILYNKTKALYMDSSVFNSFLIQTLVLDRYDKSRFEKVADTGVMKILKVK